MEEKRCGTEVFARITGFFRPVQEWNKGKTEEFKDRKKYDTETAAAKREEACSAAGTD